jgi:hypothetical protein
MTPSKSVSRRRRAPGSVERSVAADAPEVRPPARALGRNRRNRRNVCFAVVPGSLVACASSADTGRAAIQGFVAAATADEPSPALARISRAVAQMERKRHEARRAWAGRRRFAPAAFLTKRRGLSGASRKWR